MPTALLTNLNVECHKREGFMRRFHRVLSWIALASLAASCGDPLAVTGGNGTSPNEEAQDRGAELAAAVNDFSLRLVGQLENRRCRCDGNVAVAPLGVWTGLSMMAAGARGATSDEMLAGLGFVDTRADVAESAAALRQALSGIDGPEVVLRRADRLWAQEGVEVVPRLTADMARGFGATLGRADFRFDPDGARETINAWVRDTTGGALKELLPTGAVYAATNLVAADALSLSAAWQEPFDPAATFEAPFHGSAGTRMVRTMRHVAAYRYLVTDDEEVVEMPLAGGRLVVDLIAKRRAAYDEPSVPAAAMSGLAATARTIALQLPAFSVNAAIPLAGELAQVGFKGVFAPGADFSGMLAGAAVSLGGVEHQVHLRLDERGISADSATGVVASAPIASPEPLEVHFDRPFDYVVRDTVTSVFLLMGRVADPLSDAVLQPSAVEAGMRSI
jgi:serpin B